MNKRDLKKMNLYWLALKARNYMEKSEVVMLPEGMLLKKNSKFIFIEKDSDYCALSENGGDEYLLMLKPSREYFRKKLIKLLLDETK